MAQEKLWAAQVHSIIRGEITWGLRDLHVRSPELVGSAEWQKVI